MEEERNKYFQKQELERTMKQMDQNMEGLVRFQKEREAKQRKAMWLRIGLGVVFLGVFIFGIMRRRKKE